MQKEKSAKEPITLQELLALPDYEQVVVMNALSSEERARLLVEAATAGLNSAGDEVVGN